MRAQPEAVHFGGAFVSFPAAPLFLSSGPRLLAPFGTGPRPSLEVARQYGKEHATSLVDLGEGRALSRCMTSSPANPAKREKEPPKPQRKQCRQQGRRASGHSG